MKIVSTLSLRAKMKTYFDSVSKSLEVIIVPRNDNDDDAIVIMLAFPCTIEKSYK